jgi:hypothetical protein
VCFSTRSEARFSECAKGMQARFRRVLKHTLRFHEFSSGDFVRKLPVIIETSMSWHASFF